MNTRDFVTLAYEAFGGRIEGKTVLQKRIYFLNVMVNGRISFKAHYYGPYSQEVTNANSELIDLGYVQRSISSIGAISSQGFEIARHDFQLTNDGKSITARKKADYSAEWDKINTAAKKILNAGDVDYMILSAAAKAHFINGGGKKLNKKQIQKLAKNFGWTVSEKDLEKAEDFLKKIDLAS